MKPILTADQSWYQDYQRRTRFRLWRKRIAEFLVFGFLTLATVYTFLIVGAMTL